MQNVAQRTGCRPLRGPSRHGSRKRSPFARAAVAAGLATACWVVLADAAAPKPLEVPIEAALRAHNRYRVEKGVAPLGWSEVAARGAREWAARLAASDRFEHSHAKGFGENLAAGTPGFYTVETFIDLWGKEKRDFVPGVFPDVSGSGDWASVGHYTQMVWPDTRQVGCGMAQGRRLVVLVCRYLPAGNVVGRRID